MSGGVARESARELWAERRARLSLGLQAQVVDQVGNDQDGHHDEQDHRDARPLREVVAAKCRVEHEEGRDVRREARTGSGNHPYESKYLNIHLSNNIHINELYWINQGHDDVAV